MKTARSTNLLVALAASAIVGACDGSEGTAPPVPGTIVVELASPHGDDGALSLTLTGPGVSGIQTANSSYRAYWRLVSDGEARVILVGSIAPGPLFTVSVGDVNDLGAYRATLAEVANRDGVLRETAGYAVTPARPGQP
jgi:hypothetical protein